MYYEITRRSITEIVIAFAGAGTAEGPAIRLNLAAKINALAALATGHARTFVARQILGPESDANSLHVEELIIGQSAVSLLLGGTAFEGGE